MKITLMDNQRLAGKNAGGEPQFLPVAFECCICRQRRKTGKSLFSEVVGHICLDCAVSIAREVSGAGKLASVAPVMVIAPSEETSEGPTPLPVVEPLPVGNFDSLVGYKASDYDTHEDAADDAADEVIEDRAASKSKKKGKLR